MTPRYNPDDGQWHWYSEDTGWGDVLSDAEIAAAKAAGQIKDTSAEADQAIQDALNNIGVTKTFRSEHAKEWNEYQQWNQHQKEAKGLTLTEAQAEEAYGYVATGARKTMADALDLYTQYIGRTPGVPSPAQVGDWLKAQTAGAEMPAEVARLRERGRLAPLTGIPAGMEGNPVAQAILAVTNDPAVQAAMWAGAGLEGSTTGPWGTKPGDSEVGGAGEVGPWQIHPIHFKNISPEDAANPATAAAYMLPRYQDGVKSVPAELWQSDPQRAMALAVANSERPDRWHEGLTPDEALAIYTPERVANATAGVPGVTPRQAGLPTGAYQPHVSTRVLTQEEQDEAAVLDQTWGLPLGIYKAAKDAGATGADQIVGYWRQIQGAKTLVDVRALADRLGVNWTDEDLQAGITAGLQDADYANAAAAGQKPREWLDAQTKAVDDFLKSQNLTRNDLGIMRQNGITVPEYKTMTELQMNPNQWKVAMQTFGNDPDAIWTAKQLGYDPANVTGGQKAVIDLKTDPVLQMTTLWNEIPEAIKPGLGQLNPTMIQNEYTAAKDQARAQGKYLAPGDFLKSQYPGLFGGGTRWELQHDLERLGAYEAPPVVEGNVEWGIAPHQLSVWHRLAGVGLADVQAGTRQRIQNLVAYRAGEALMEYPASAEMVATRSMAEAFLRAPGPLGTQSLAEHAAQHEAIARQYPELASRYGAGEFETPEEKARRLKKKRLAAAGTAPPPTSAPTTGMTGMTTVTGAGAGMAILPSGGGSTPAVVPRAAK